MAGPASTIQVLHVDDEPDLADMVSAFLERENDRISVCTATSAEAGLDVLAANDVDCIVSDFDMPGANGLDFLEEVREDHPDLPFILYTGKGSEEVASEAISAGVTEYMQKERGSDQYTVLANRIHNAVEQYRARREAERTRRRLEELSESSDDCLWMFDRDWEELLFISGYESVWDRPQEAIRKNPQDFLEGVHPDDRDRVEDAMGRLSAGESIDIEYRIVRGDGDVGTVWVKGEPIVVDGDVVRVVGFTRDVTDRKEQSRRLETLISNLPGIAYRCRNEPTWTMEFVRGNCESLTGYSAEAIAEGEVSWGGDIMHPDDREENWERVQEAVREDRPFEVTYRIRTNDGATKWIWERGQPVATSDDDVVLEGFVTDVTDRKAREQRLRRTERRYEAIFNDPNILVGLTDPDGTVLDINDTAMGYVDADLDDIVGDPLWESPWFSYSAELQRDLREWLARAADGQYVEFDAEVAGPDENRRVVEGVIRPVTDADGEVVSLLVSDRDVTERKRRERELEQYEAYLQESTDVITVLEQDGTIQYESPAVARVLGYEPGELIGTNGFELIHPDDVDAVVGAFDELVADPDGTTTVECRFRTADDDWRWLEVRGSNQLDNDAIEGIVTNNRDITERKERESALEETTAILSTLVETLPIGVLVEDESREALAVNERFVELFEMEGTPEDLVGQDCRRMLASVRDLFDDSRSFVDRTNELIETGDSVRDEEFALADDRVFVRSHEPIELPDGSGHLWTYRDVTDRKQREGRLEATTRRLEALFDKSPDMINLHDPDGRIIDPNPRLQEKTGYSEAELTDMRVWDLDPSVDPDGARRFWDRVEYGDRDRFEGCYERRDGSTFPVEIHTSRLEVGGKDRFMVISRDVTDRKERERELEAKNERLEDFASIVSHDLRNPLTVAQGRLELLEEDCESEHVAELDQALTRMSVLIEELLTLARQGDQVGEVEPLEVERVITQCWGNVATGQASIEVESVPSIAADRGRFQQLLENLFRNAIEHGGDDVTVRVGELDDGFFVADDGPGIPPDEHGDVFEAAYTTKHDGTGFGLVIVEQVADAHGWDIEVTDGADGGARFEFHGVEFADR